MKEIEAQEKSWEFLMEENEAEEQPLSVGYFLGKVPLSFLLLFCKSRKFQLKLTPVSL